MVVHGGGPHAAAVVEELGDVLWYLTVVAARGGLTLGDIVGNLNRGFSDWQRAGDEALTGQGTDFMSTLRGKLKQRSPFS